MEVAKCVNIRICLHMVQFFSESCVSMLNSKVVLFGDSRSTDTTFLGLSFPAARQFRLGITHYSTLAAREIWSIRFRKSQISR